MNSLKIMWGALRYEYLMQIRRPALWLTFLGLAFLLARTLIASLSNVLPTMYPPTLHLAASLTLLSNELAPLGVGICLADRLPRDRRIRVEELLNTLPGTLRMRMLSKYLGATLATLTPAFLLYLLILGFAVWQTGRLADWQLPTDPSRSPLLCGDGPAGHVLCCCLLGRLSGGDLGASLPVSLLWLLVLG